MRTFCFFSKTADRVYACRVPADGQPPVYLLSKYGEPALTGLYTGTHITGRQLLPIDYHFFQKLQFYPSQGEKYAHAQAWARRLQSHVNREQHWLLTYPAHWTAQQCEELRTASRFGQVTLFCEEDAVLAWAIQAHGAPTDAKKPDTLFLRTEDGAFRATWYSADGVKTLLGEPIFPMLDQALTELCLEECSNEAIQTQYRQEPSFRRFLLLHMQQLRREYLQRCAGNGFTETPCSIWLQCSKKDSLQLTIDRQKLRRAMNLPQNGMDWLTRCEQFLQKLSMAFPNSRSRSYSLICHSDDLLMPELLRKVCSWFPTAHVISDPAGSGMVIKGMLRTPMKEKLVLMMQRKEALHALRTGRGWTSDVQKSYHQMINNILTDLYNYGKLLHQEDSRLSLRWFSNRLIPFDTLVKNAGEQFQRTYSRDIRFALQFHTHVFRRQIAAHLNDAYGSICAALGFPEEILFDRRLLKQPSVRHKELHSTFSQLRETADAWDAMEACFLAYTEPTIAPPEQKLLLKLMQDLYKISYALNPQDRNVQLNNFAELSVKLERTSWNMTQQESAEIAVELAETALDALLQSPAFQCKITEPWYIGSCDLCTDTKE